MAPIWTELAISTTDTFFGHTLKLNCSQFSQPVYTFPFCEANWAIMSSSVTFQQTTSFCSRLSGVSTTDTFWGIHISRLYNVFTWQYLIRLQHQFSKSTEFWLSSKRLRTILSSSNSWSVFNYREKPPALERQRVKSVLVWSYMYSVLLFHTSVVTYTRSHFVTN